jgi:hypothetical protein
MKKRKKMKVTPINEKLQAILDMQKDIPDVNIATIDDKEIVGDNYLDYLMGDETISENLGDMVEFEDFSSENYID